MVLHLLAAAGRSEAVRSSGRCQRIDKSCLFYQNWFLPLSTSQNKCQSQNNDEDAFRGGTTDSDLDDNDNSSNRGLHPSSTIVDVTPLADRIREQFRAHNRALVSSGQDPLTFVGILGPTGKYAELYSDRIAETCREDGIQYQVQRSLGHQPSDLEHAIEVIHQRSDVDGVLVFYPIFHHRLLVDEPHSSRAIRKRTRGVYYKSYDDHLRNLVCPTKDVEGLCREYNSRKLFRAQRMRPSLTVLKLGGHHHHHNIFPCTALSVKHILDYYHLKKSPFFDEEQISDDKINGDPCLVKRQWRGQTVTIVNRSEILGRPLAAMLALCGAKVYSVDINSILEFREGGCLRSRHHHHQAHDLEWCMRQSSVIVTGVPDPEFRLPLSGILPGTTVVNVSEFDNVCDDTLLTCPSLQFIPQIGKVTVAVLMQNLLRLRQKNAQETQNNGSV